jgi:uncharacterized protein YjbI with pentapeptide repeats
LDTAILVGDDLRNAALQGSHLRDADLTNAKLDEACLQRADLTNARGASLRSAITDAATVHPDRLRHTPPAG